MIDLCDLPLDHILSYVDQQVLINLALTNYKYYEPCLKQLYKRILIREEYSLEVKSTRKYDFQNATQSILSGTKRLTSKSNNLKMLAARLQSLIVSLSINAKLLDFIEEVNILGLFNQEVNRLLIELLRILEKSKVKRLLVVEEFLKDIMFLSIRNGGFENLTFILVDDLADLEIISHMKNLEELDIGQSKCTKGKEVLIVDPKFLLIKRIKKLKGLNVTTDYKNYKLFMLYIMREFKSNPFLLTLDSFSLNLYHDFDLKNVQEFLRSNIISWGHLKELIIHFGCDDENCAYSCISQMSFPQIRCQKLSFVQETYSRNDTHKAGQLWDLAIVNILKDLDTSNLIYLSIRHKCPQNGVYKDGMEGNYLQRIEFFSDFLPNYIESDKLTLCLPTLLKVLSCYEQPMNTMLWNGCKCPHCAKYLDLLDEFLLTHKYYNFDLQEFKDLITSNVFATISEWLSQRDSYRYVSNDILLYHFPLRRTLWNFHDNKFSISFRCLGHNNYEEYEFDEDVDYFLDAEESIDPCRFQEFLFLPIAECFSHYVSDFIMRLCGLYRGNPENLRMDNKDLNDGAIFEKFRRIYFNGLSFSVDKERNGTNFFETIYD